MPSQRTEQPQKAAIRKQQAKQIDESSETAVIDRSDWVQTKLRIRFRLNGVYLWLPLDIR